jgi:hypothetical protein
MTLPAGGLPPDLVAVACLPRVNVLIGDATT